MNKSLIGVGVCLLVSAPAFAAEEYTAPRTAFGHPDLQGIWTNASQTPLERPRELGTQRAFTIEQARNQEQAWLNYIDQRSAPSDPNRPPPTDTNTALGYDNFWVDMGTNVINIDGEFRTSIVIEPENGRIPFIERGGIDGAGRSGRPVGTNGQSLGAYDGPEARPLGERCLLSFGSSSGPPMLPVMYNNNYQIVQTQDYALILVEMVHDARIIPLRDSFSGRSMPKWMGDSIGYYEGDTLVVETGNFNPLHSFRGSTPDLKVTERFTRVADGKINYRFTMEDPAVFSEPWSGEIAMYRRPAGEKMYEYACREGNYALPGILAGARMAESEAAAPN